MQKLNISEVIKQQQDFFSKGGTRDLNFRIDSIKKLKTKIIENQHLVIEALNKDLNRNFIDSYSAEVAFVYDEIDFILKNIKKWAAPTKVPGSILTWPSKAEIYREPFGNVLIIAPWNYPFQLVFSPLVGAIAAGNTVLIKPSELSTNTEKIIQKIIGETFDESHVSVVTGGVDVSQKILDEKFDFIFFTGSTQVGKIIMEKAAKNLTPVCLELGGKSPAIVDESANLEVAAKRIVWGKFFNAGQTCVAPDFVYIDEKVKSEFLIFVKKFILEFYGDNELKCPDYCRIINVKHFDRLVQILDSEKIIYGGNRDRENLFISPTLLDVNGFDSASMQDEIFGPLLPILTYTSFGEAVKNIKRLPKPLALYLFSENKENQNLVLEGLSFGGGCINDCLLHLANAHLPFGGVGPSGMGMYHGQYSFETFSHKKSILKKSNLIDFSFRYPPYTDKKIGLLKKFLK